ncbi:integumentary mucin B.1-like [Amia ocellicauda]|uniref:integumentary mucin B.1-like n=1 Tax=Amia ocellicauda TaxID=2972642 RepID=UPI0034647966
MTYNATDCCDMKICVEKTCEYNNRIYKVGDEWKDPSNTCSYYKCEKSGITIKEKVCQVPDCDEKLRIWDEDHCCYTCNRTCQPVETTQPVIRDNCNGNLTITQCQGYCEFQSMMMYSAGVYEMDSKCKCCQEEDFEIRNATLTCPGNTFKAVSYKYITSCSCEICTEDR